MYEDTKDRARFEAEMKERARLLALTEEQAMAEGTPIWYQRMRYLREIEAAEWLKRVQAGLPADDRKPMSPYGRAGRSKGLYQRKDRD